MKVSIVIEVEPEDNVQDEVKGEMTALKLIQTCMDNPKIHDIELHVTRTGNKP